MKSFFLIVLLISWLTPYISSQPSPIKSDNFEGVIFDASYRLPFYKKRTKTFTPTKKEVLQLEENLKPLVEEFCLNNNLHLKFECPQLEVFKEYYRQYFGYYNKQGERIIYINCFLQPVEDWETHYIQIHDGGTSVWQAHYNCNTKRLINLSVNGKA